MTQPILLKSTDGQIFPVDRDTVKLITSIDKDISKVENLDIAIPVECTDGETLGKIIEWAVEQQNQRPSRGERISAFDRRFFDMDIVLLGKIIESALVLDMKTLYDSARRVYKEKKVVDQVEEGDLN